MKTLRIAIVFLALAWFFFFFQIHRWAPQLPETVATHFDAAGRPNGWMPHAQHVRFLLSLGAGLPLFIIALFYSLRFSPASLINIPNREFWLAPERRAQTDLKMLRHGIFLAAMLVSLFACVHLIIVAANLALRPGVSPADALEIQTRFVAPATKIVAAFFIAAVIAWAATLLLLFRKPRR